MTCTQFPKKVTLRTLMVKNQTKNLPAVFFFPLLFIYVSVSLGPHTRVCLSFSAPEGKRSSGLTAVWVARNRFAVLDRMHSVSTFESL